MQDNGEEKMSKIEEKLEELENDTEEAKSQRKSRMESIRRNENNSKGAKQVNDDARESK